MPVTTKYIVKHKFNYGLRVYQPGEEFEPEGARNDGAIIRHFTRVEQVVTPPEEPKVKERKAVKEVANA